MNKLDLTTIILTYNEEIHISRCLGNVCPFSKKVIVVDSPSTDRTVEICKEFENVEVVVHKYPGNQAEQFNWALDNVEISTEWVLRVDADEYLEQELIMELWEKLPKMNSKVSGVVVPIGREFMGRRLHHGIVDGVVLTRLFRTGTIIIQAVKLLFYLMQNLIWLRIVIIMIMQRLLKRLQLSVHRKKCMLRCLCFGVRGDILPIVIL